MVRVMTRCIVCSRSYMYDSEDGDVGACSPPCKEKLDKKISSFDISNLKGLKHAKSTNKKAKSDSDTEVSGESVDEARRDDDVS